MKLMGFLITNSSTMCTHSSTRRNRSPPLLLGRHINLSPIGCFGKGNFYSPLPNLSSVKGVSCFLFLFAPCILNGRKMHKNLYCQISVMVFTISESQGFMDARPVTSFSAPVFERNQRPKKEKNILCERSERENFWLLLILSCRTTLKTRTRLFEH